MEWWEWMSWIAVGLAGVGILWCVVVLLELRYRRRHGLPIFVPKGYDWSQHYTDDPAQSPEVPT